MQLEEEKSYCDPDIAERLCMEDEEDHQLANKVDANVYLPDKLEHNENTHTLSSGACDTLRILVLGSRSLMACDT
jgi:hypothetical protein